MGRAERRKNKDKPQVLYVNVDVDKLKEDIMKDAVKTSFKLMLAIPVMVLHDNYGNLNRLNVDGKCREERFADECLNVYDSFEKGYITFDDLMDCLKEETGAEFDF